MKKNISPGTMGLFVFRAVGQNSLQATVEQAFSTKPLIIPRTGTAAPIGVPTMKSAPLPPEK